MAASKPNANAVLTAERAAWCDTLERLGPDAPTLCAGPPAFVAATMAGVKRMGRFQTRRLKPHGLALALPDEMVILRAGHPTATMTGAIGECVLYLSGRRDAAVVELTGDPEAIDALRTAKLGI